MKQLIKYSLCLYLLILCTIGMRAQNMTVNVARQVPMGENFRLSYTVNSDDVSDFRAGNIPSALEVLAGPYTSSQSSFQMINGHTSSSSSITYTYTLYASKVGTYTIPAAQAVVNGKRIASHAVKVVVTERSKNAGAHQSDADDRGQMRVAGSRISGNDLFIKVSANKRVVHEQEPVLLTYKVYTLLELTQLEGKMPDLTGFHSQEVKLPQQKNFHVERMNGKAYRCVVWSQYVMYPQITGNLTIPSITFKGVVVQQNRNVDPFEAFFNGGSGYTEVRRDIVAPGLKIQVLPLPERPKNFSGGVGNFTVSSQVDRIKVKTGDPVQFRVVVGGVGNLKLLKQPEPVFPKDFDRYAPKVTDKTHLTEHGLEGNMIYDYLIVARNQGKYTLPAVEFCYFDTKSNSYKTVQTKPVQIEVELGNGGNTRVTDYGDKPEDIRDIKQGSVDAYNVSQSFFASTGYWLSLALSVGVFVMAYIFLRKRTLEQADSIGLKGKKASRVAGKRLKSAQKLMAASKVNDFYEEVLKALWGYVGDKLNMPVELLSKENIAGKLHEAQVDDSTIQLFITAIDECEYERYAPGDVAGNMNKTFEAAMTAITDIEKVIKQKKKGMGVGAGMLLLLMTMLIPQNISGATKASADKAYLQANYQQAINEYETLLKHQKNAMLYYNLGNAYFRSSNYTNAILNYERALKLEPGNDDVKFNLQFARSKTIDKLSDRNEMFFVTWYRACVNFTSVDRWAVLSIYALIASLVALLAYLFAERMLYRKIGFYGFVTCFILFVLCCLFAFQQKQYERNFTGAVVTSPSVSVYNAPTVNSNAQFVIHEGTRVDIVDEGIAGWRKINLSDGRNGWIVSKSVENI